MTSSPIPVRPMLKPAVRLLWRGASTLQLGLSPRHATILRDVSAGERAMLSLLDGSRDIDALVVEAADVGLSRDDVHALLTALLAAGALDDATVPMPAASETQRQQLEPDLLTASLRNTEPGATAALLARRSSASVVVHGGSRVGATLALLLSAAGVGAVSCVDDTALRHADIAPGGVREVAATTRGDAVLAALDAFHAQTRRGTADVTDGKKRRPRPEARPANPSLAVVTSVGGFPAATAIAAARELPHLFVDVCETTASVGPFVQPGVTPCLRCLQLGRGDRDRRWPMLAAQLLSRGTGVEACDVTLATLAATIGAMHALQWIEGSDVSTLDSAGGVVEFDLLDHRLRRRSVPVHPACGCGAGQAQAVMALSEPSRSLSA